MKNRGFTLIELLAVIIIISILVILLLPRITNSVNNHSKKIDELTLSMVKQAAGLYVDDNSSKFLQIDGNKYCVTVNELVKKDYLKDNTEYKGENITYTKSIEVTYNSGFDYELKDECTATDYIIEYSGVGNNNYKELVKPGERLVVEFNNFIPPKVVVYQDENKLNRDKYTYENNVLTIESVEGNIKVEYREKAYLAQLPEKTYFKQDGYREKIKSINFVNYIYEDLDNTLVNYDLSANNDSSIIGWVDKDYNLYIGSDWNIYSKDLSNAFKNMTALQSINFDNLNTSESTNMSNMFYGMSKLTNLDLNKFNTSKVTNMKEMFQGMSSLTNLNISSFDTSNVTDMSNMFYGVSKLTNLNLNNFDTSKVTNMKRMFQEMSSLTNLNVSNFDTSNVSGMYSMFSKCSNLIALDLSNFNTGKVNNMSNMFSYMYALSELNISGFDSSNSTDMQYMFYECNNLSTLDLSHLKTPKVKNMSYMFANMYKLTSLKIDSFDTSQVSTMNNMFSKCSSLTSLDLSNFSTGSTTIMSNMFYGMTGITTLDLSSFDTINVTLIDDMFYGCNNLATLRLDKASFLNVTDYSRMFNGVASNVVITVLDEDAENFVNTALSGSSINGTVIIAQKSDG